MTIRARLSLWYGVVMFTALVVMGVLLYQELIIEPKQAAREHHKTPDKANSDEPDDTFEDVAGIVLWCCLPALGLAVAGGWWLMRKSLAPVAGLAESAKNITARNLKARLPRTHNGDEIDQLAEISNSMLGRLDDSFRQVHEFSLHASHELKTPLTVLCSQAETKISDKATPLDEREYHASQLDEFRRLSRIVDGLTLLAKADVGMAPLEMGRIRLDEIVRDGFEDAQMLAESHGVSVQLAICDEAVVEGDADRLRQLLLNLVENAVKFNQQNGSVKMALSRTAQNAEFIITNTGPGISAHALPRVFDRFFRGDASHSATVDGCGLGLSIAQWIVSAHRGSIKIISEPSTHTTVTVRLPLYVGANNSRD